MPERIPAILKANEDLTAAVNDLSSKVNRLRTSTRNVVIFSVILALVVIGVVVNAVRTDRADSKANRVQQYQMSTCVSGNEFRRQQRVLWTDIDTLIRSTNKSRANQRFVDQVQAKVDAAFAPRDCTQVTK
jgi:hypothetical protein